MGNNLLNKAKLPSIRKSDEKCARSNAEKAKIFVGNFLEVFSLNEREVYSEIKEIDKAETQRKHMGTS